MGMCSLLLYHVSCSSDLCFEHKLCAQLTSSDPLQTVKDNEQQKLLLSSVQSVTVKNDVQTPQKSETRVQEKLLKPKKSGDFSHFVYESIIPATQSLSQDDSGRRPSIKHSPSLSKIEEESPSNTSACSEEAGHLVRSKLSPVKLMPLQDLPQHIIKSPHLAAIEEESSGNTPISTSPNNVSCSPTTVNRGIMQSLMDQKIENASRDENRNGTPPDVEVNSDLASVSLDPAIWSDSDPEQVTNVEDSPQPSSHRLSVKMAEKDITPAMKAIGSVSVVGC